MLYLYITDWSGSNTFTTTSELKCLNKPEPDKTKLCLTVDDSDVSLVDSGEQTSNRVNVKVFNFDRITLCWCRATK